jgi:capsular exopolysaccharide synthesis family protein
VRENREAAILEFRLRVYCWPYWRHVTGDKMDFQEYARIARRRWKTIFGCVLAAVGCAALLTTLATPVYSSTARLFVSTPQGGSTEAYQGSLFSAERIGSYAHLVRSPEVAEAVIEDLGLRMTPDQLTERISPTVVPETVILEVTATDQNPQRAQAIAQSVAEEVSALVSVLETPPSGAAAPIKATIVNAAPLPDTPTSPKPMRNLMLAGVLGLLIGLAAGVVRELLDTTVKGPEDVSAAVDLPVMGNIAYDPSVPKRPLVTALDLNNPRLEAFRVLRTNMQFVDVDHDSRVYTVTSSVPEEGKTTSATNLAIMTAQAGQRVLLVEGDLRRPRIHMENELEQAVGLTTVLVGRTSLEEAVQTPDVPNLSVLTSGLLPPNPAELLQSRAMADLLVKARDRYDVVIIDAPPLLPVTDAALLAAQSDGALVVVRHGRTTKEQLREAVDRLRAVGGRPLGAVLNMVPARGTAYADRYSIRYPEGVLPLEPGAAEAMFRRGPTPADSGQRLAPTASSTKEPPATSSQGRAAPGRQPDSPVVPAQRPGKADPRPGKADPRPGKAAQQRPRKADQRPSKAEQRPSKAEQRPSKAEQRPGNADQPPGGADQARAGGTQARATSVLEPEDTAPILLHHRGKLSESGLPPLLRPLLDSNGFRNNVVAFRALYESQRKRQGGREPDPFSDASSTEPATAVSARIVLFEAVHDGEQVAAILCLSSPPTLHYHRGASNDFGRRTCAPHQLFVTAAQWPRKNSHQEFLLGGSSESKQIPLTFMEPFDPMTLPRPLYVGKWVHDPIKYAELTGKNFTNGAFQPWRPVVELQRGL